MTKIRLIRWIKNKRKVEQQQDTPQRIGVKKIDFKNRIQRVTFNIDVPPLPRKHRRFLPSEIKALQRATAKDLIYNGSFQEAVAPLLILAECFAIMPVIGIKSGSAAKMYFAWASVRTIYSIIVFVLMMILTGLTIGVTFRHNVQFDSIVPVIFYSSVVFSMVSFGYLATKWPALMAQWENVERQLPTLKSYKDKGRLAHRVRMISIVVMTLSLAEHILSIVSVVHYSNNCQNKSSDPIKDFFLTQLTPIFTYTSYAPWKAFVGKLLNFIATFTWTYMDVFVIIVSVGLSSHFKQITENIMEHKGESMPEDFWAERRIQYRSLCNLCEDVDNAISQITIVSFSNNLFFICVQLLKSLRPMRTFVLGFYFWFSLIFLISRTLAVSLYSAGIHDESKKPIQAFRAVPSEAWCLEVKRFSDEVTNDTVALSGMKFFYLTRKLVLSVAGTIVTYELVLIQFHENDEDFVPC